jgi:hypothetical protein
VLTYFIYESNNFCLESEPVCILESVIWSQHSILVNPIQYIQIVTNKLTTKIYANISYQILKHRHDICVILIDKQIPILCLSLLYFNHLSDWLAKKTSVQITVFVIKKYPYKVIYCKSVWIEIIKILKIFRWVEKSCDSIPFFLLQKVCKYLGFKTRKVEIDENTSLSFFKIFYFNFVCKQSNKFRKKSLTVCMMFLKTFPKILVKNDSFWKGKFCKLKNKFWIWDLFAKI